MLKAYIHNDLAFMTFTVPRLQIAGVVLLIGGFGVWVLYFVVELIAVVVKVTSEERLLIETFGEQYTKYQQRVPQLIPGKQLLTRQQ